MSGLIGPLVEPPVRDDFAGTAHDERGLVRHSLRKISRMHFFSAFCVLRTIAVA
jgi:hypothetical protein